MCEGKREHNKESACERERERERDGAREICTKSCIYFYSIYYVFIFNALDVLCIPLRARTNMCVCVERERERERARKREVYTKSHIHLIYRERERERDNYQFVPKNCVCFGCFLQRQRARE